MNKNIDSVFTTTDLALAAFIALRYPIVSVDKTNPKKAIFHFPKNKQLEELVDAYWRNETQVEPKEYFSQIRVVKSRLYSKE